MYKRRVQNYFIIIKIIFYKLNIIILFYIFYIQWKIIIYLYINNAYTMFFYLTIISLWNFDIAIWCLF